jgi:chromosomal replication initiation ATPase DnaA
MVLLLNAIDDSWSRVGTRLKVTLGNDVYDSWLASLKLEGVRETVMYCSSPTDFLCRWIKKNYAETITNCIKLEYSDVTMVRFLHRKPGVLLLPKEVAHAPAPAVAPSLPLSEAHTSHTKSAQATDNEVPKLPLQKRIRDTY